MYVGCTDISSSCLGGSQLLHNLNVLSLTWCGESAGHPIAQASHCIAYYDAQPRHKHGANLIAGGPSSDRFYLFSVMVRTVPSTSRLNTFTCASRLSTGSRGCLVATHACSVHLACDGGHQQAGRAEHTAPSQLSSDFFEGVASFGGHRYGTTGEGEGREGQMLEVNFFLFFLLLFCCGCPCAHWTPRGSDKESPRNLSWRPHSENSMLAREAVYNPSNRCSATDLHSIRLEAEAVSPPTISRQKTEELLENNLNRTSQSALGSAKDSEREEG